MKKLFTKVIWATISPLLIVSFFIPNLIFNRLPIPADNLLSLYHPWRDSTNLGYDAGNFPAKNPLITDPILQTYPWKKLVVDSLKKFEMPLWDPYNFTGRPLFANIQSSPLAITNLIFLVFPFNYAWALQIILSLGFLSLFTYLFLKSENVSNAYAIFSSFAISFSGFFVSWLTWGTIVSTAMWLPLILFSINKFYEKQNAKYFLLLVISIFMTIVSGHFQTAFYVILASIIFNLYLFFNKRVLKLLIFIILAHALGLAISAVQLIPSYELINLSNRAIDQSYWPGREDWFIPYQNLVQLLVPDFFGNPTTYNYWGVWNYAEFVSYIGILPLFFALIAVFHKTKVVIVFILLATLSLLLAVKNPLSVLPYSLNLPFISSLQPSRIIVLFIFSLTVLSAHGISIFINEKLKKSTFIALSSIFAPITFLFILTLFSKRIFPNPSYQAITVNNFKIIIFACFLLVVVIAAKQIRVKKTYLITLIFLTTLFELFRFSYKFTPFVKNELINPQTEVTQYLVNQKRPFRVLETDRRIASPNSLVNYKIESVSGYDPIYLKDYAIFANVWQSKQVKDKVSFNRIITPQDYKSQLTNFLNVKYILTFDEITDKSLEKVLDEGQTKVYENKNYKERIFFPDQVVKKSTQEEVLQALAQNSENNENKVFSTELDYSGNGENKIVNINNYKESYISAEVISDIEAPIIISNPNYPGWKAFIDGNESRIMTVNYMFQSVLLPAGKHTLVLKYLPESLKKGIFISTIGIILMLISTVYLWRKKYQ